MAKSKSLCSGCRNQYYHHNCEGGCWSYKDAKVVTRVFVGTFQPPPYTWIPHKTLSCWHHDGQTGLHPLPKDDPRVVVRKKEKE